MLFYLLRAFHEAVFASSDSRVVRTTCEDAIHDDAKTDSRNVYSKKSRRVNNLNQFIARRNVIDIETVILVVFWFKF